MSGRCRPPCGGVLTPRSPSPGFGAGRYNATPGRATDCDGDVPPSRLPDRGGAGAHHAAGNALRLAACESPPSTAIPSKASRRNACPRRTFGPARYFPGDRLFAVENGPSGFDPAAPAHQPKIKYLMLMRNESLARLETRYDDATGTLVVREGGREAVRAELSTREGRLAVEAFLRRFMPAELRGPPKVLAAPDGYRFTDSRRGYVSLINLASVQDLEARIGAPVAPLRFRGNVHVEGLAPWAELDLVGAVLAAPGGPRLRVTKRIERCAATNVDPATRPARPARSRRR